MEDTDYLEVKVDGPENIPVPVDVFLRAMNGMNEVASEVDRAVSVSGKKEYRWRIIKLQIGSASTTWEPERTSIVSPKIPDLRVAQLIRSGLQSIQRRERERPTGFTDKALRTLRGVLLDIKEPFSLFVADRENSVTPNLEAVAQIDTWLGPKYESIGSVEGRLDRVSAHKRLELTVYDRDNNKIDCFFPDSMKERVKEALYSEVYIPGRVVYRSDGIPVAVYPIDIIPIRNDDFDITKAIGSLDLGMPSEDYVRSLRDE